MGTDDFFLLTLAPQHHLFAVFLCTLYILFNQINRMA